MHDALKNVPSIFGETQGRRALHGYRPFGVIITVEGNMAEENKLRFSSKYMDKELRLIYYNYCHFMWLFHEMQMLELVQVSETLVKYMILDLKIPDIEIKQQKKYQRNLN